jgi:hypothetical protein
MSKKKAQDDELTDKQIDDNAMVKEYIRDVTVDVMNLMNKRMRDDMGHASARLGSRIAGLAAVLCLLIAKSSELDFEVFCAMHKELFDELTASEEYKEYITGEDTTLSIHLDGNRDEENGDPSMTHIWQPKPDETIH